MQYLENEQWTAAVSSFEESLQLDPDFKAPWVNMAVAFLRLHQWQRVLQVGEGEGRRQELMAKKDGWELKLIDQF